MHSEVPAKVEACASGPIVLAEQLPSYHHYLGNLKRLAHEACVARATFSHYGFGHGTHEYYWNARNGPVTNNGAQNLGAIHNRHHVVERGQIRVILSHYRKSLPPIRSC